ncbi:RNase H family protein [Corynebacterium confusum]|uniref:RNase H family protein n=1 Tax=Corynebacterium confusum TaxID=71254 RepID=UPI00338D94B5|nr:Ribonuclease H [Corynebacterium confusum]
MHNAPVHVAIAMWDIPWKSAAEGKLNGWVIAVDAKPGPRFVRTGRTTEEDTVGPVMRDLNDAISGIRSFNGAKKKVWCNVGRRRGALRLELEKQGYLVTGSFSEYNRSCPRASKLRTVEETKAKRQGKRNGQSPKRKPTPPPATEAHWWPQFSDFSNAFDATPARIATDASSDTNIKGASCFVASNGDYQLLTRRTKASTDELELEALTLALKYLVHTDATDVLIESDSQAALRAVDYITGQGKLGKRWRGIHPGALSRFQQAWKDNQGQRSITFRRVMGHSGDPLNRAADKIAIMGLRAIAYRQKEVRDTLAEGIDKALQEAAKDAHKRAASRLPESVTRGSGSGAEAGSRSGSGAESGAGAGARNKRRRGGRRGGRRRGGRRRGSPGAGSGP